MSDDVKVMIGADAKGFTAGLGQVKGEIDALKNKTKEGFFDLEGEKRVERNLGNMVQGLAKAESGAEALALSLDHVENVFKSSLGASVAVAAIVTLIQKIIQAREEWEKFKTAGVEAMQEIGKSIAGGQWLSASEAIEKRLQAVREALAKAQEQAAVKGISGGLTGLFSGDLTGRVRALQEEEKILKSQRDLNGQLLHQEIERKNTADARREDDELNGRLLRESLQSIDEKNRLQEEGWAKEDAEIKKLADEERECALENHEHEKKLAREKTEEERKLIIDNFLWEKKQKGEFYEWQKGEIAKLATLEEQRATLVANKEKADRAAMIADEMKPPGQRNDERQAARAAARAEDNAIKRIAQKAQDNSLLTMRGKRMTDAERDAMADNLRQQRAQDKTPQMEKDISEMNKTIKKLEQKIGVL